MIRRDKANTQKYILQKTEHERQKRQNTLGCYNNTYLKSDILLLFGVFDTFGNTCLKHYIFNLLHFYTAPGLVWQTLLKIASEYCEHEAKSKDCELCLYEFKLELLRDIYMLLMFEKSSQGRITQGEKRYPKLNNKYITEHYNLDETTTYLQDLDANSIYGLAVIQNLLTHGFAW